MRSVHNIFYTYETRKRFDATDEGIWGVRRPAAVTRAPEEGLLFISAVLPARLQPHPPTSAWDERPTLFQPLPLNYLIRAFSPHCDLWENFCLSGRIKAKTMRAPFFCPSKTQRVVIFYVTGRWLSISPYFVWYNRQLTGGGIIFLFINDTPRQFFIRFEFQVYNINIKKYVCVSSIYSLQEIILNNCVYFSMLSMRVNILFAK